MGKHVVRQEYPKLTLFTDAIIKALKCMFIVQSLGFRLNVCCRYKMSLKVDRITWVVAHWIGMWMVMALCSKLPLFRALAGTWGKQLCWISFWHCHKAQVRLGFQPAQVRENWGADSICSLNVNFHSFQRNKKVSNLIQSAYCVSRWFINFRADSQTRSQGSIVYVDPRNPQPAHPPAAESTGYVSSRCLRPDELVNHLLLIWQCCIPDLIQQKTIHDDSAVSIATFQINHQKDIIH